MSGNNESKAHSVSSATRKEAAVYTAHQRAQAVLSVWTERRRPATVCQELGINATVLGQWEQRAMAGMLRALEPRGYVDPSQAPALTPKLERLLGSKAAAQHTKLARLDKRLAKLQQEPAVTSPPSAKEK